MLVLSTGCLHKYGLNRIFQIAKELEFEGIEITMNEVYDTHDKKYIAQLIDTFDMPVVSLQVNKRVNSPKEVKHVVTMAESLNIPFVIVRVPYFMDFKFVTWFKTKLPELQDKTDVHIAVENAPAGRGFILPEYALSDLNDVKKYAHVCLDTSHLSSHHVDLMRAYTRLKKKLSYIHLSNWHKGKEHWMLHEGLLPLESFLTKLAKDKFSGPISIKLKLEHIGEDNLNTVIKNLKKAKDFYDEYFKGNL